jgi:hypothetical protein
MEQTPSSPGRSPELPSVSPSSNGETLGSFSHPENSQEGARERLEQAVSRLQADYLAKRYGRQLGSRQ